VAALGTATRLDRLNVLCLPTLRPFGHAELDLLAFLKAAESARLDRREMHEDVFAILAADETIAFRVVEPLYCSCFHLLLTSLIEFTSR